MGQGACSWFFTCNQADLVQDPLKRPLLFFTLKRTLRDLFGKPGHEKAKPKCASTMKIRYLTSSRKGRPTFP